jgi:formylglycine-generating enzyme required for sulfatase activity
MRTISFILIILISILFVFLPDVAGSAPAKMSIAVVEFDVQRTLDIADAGTMFAESMVRAASETREFVVRDKVLLKKTLEKEGLYPYGLIDFKTASKIGSLYGVKGFITGSVVKVGDLISLRVRLMDTNMGAVLKTTDVNTYDPKSIPAKIKEIAYQFAGKEPEKKDQLKGDETQVLQDMILVGGGCFQMGDTFGEEIEDEWPVHEVCLDDFFIDNYEVTQMDYQEVMGKNPSRFIGDRNPVEKVTWKDANEYCEKVGKRLPTEAEWEYAAREGGKNVRFGTGTDVVNSDIVNFDARSKYDIEYSEEGQFLGRTMPVGSYKPNALGLYDMSGNVWEWVADWYGSHYYSTSPRENPKGPPSGEIRGLRGGSWNDNARNLRATYRGWSNPQWITLNGFRCAKDF